MDTLPSLLAHLGLDPFQQGLQLLDPLKAAPDPTLPLLAGPLTAANLAGAQKSLLRHYPSGHGGTLAALHHSRWTSSAVKLGSLALPKSATEAFLLLPPAAEQRSSFNYFEGLLAHLLSPEGCPWDREQTHASLRSSLLEESYEVLDALDDANPSRLREELGDLLLQIVFQAQIARDASEFTIREVVQGISDKLIRRHPHVFGDASVTSAWEVEENWEKIRRAEKRDASLLEGVPKQMPALAYSQAIQQRAARTGFDWEMLDDIYAKVDEELGELRQAGTPAEQEAELGDVLFVLVNLGRRMGIEVESALRTTNQRFYRRFRHMEDLCRQRGLDFQSLPLAEKDKLWEEAKIAVG